MFHPTLSKSGRFFFAPIIKFCEYLGNHYPAVLLRLRYRFVFGKGIDLKNPKDLNEKIIWSKLYSDTTRWVDLADKYKVRDYVESLGLADILVKLYDVWYSADDVRFDRLPDRFIIKANNGDGKGTNKIIRKNADSTDQENEVRQTVRQWLSRKNIGSLHAEPHYNKMKPCVVVEEVLPLKEGESSLTDYKLWCINGKCHYIFVCGNRNATGNSAEVMTYDRDWKAHPEFSVFNSDYKQADEMPRPENLNKMIDVAERLSKGFPILRVDLYNIDGKIYFGELTFTSQGGFMDYFTEDFLILMGDKVRISDFPKKISGIESKG